MLGLRDPMTQLFSKYSPFTYAVTRVVVGFLFACHGAQKLFGVLGSVQEELGGMGMAAGLIEFIAGILVAIGLLTRLAALLASGEMAFAYFKVHAPIGFWPIMNGGEWAVLYCFFFLYVATKGPGDFSVDSVVGKYRKTLYSGKIS